MLKNISCQDYPEFCRELFSELLFRSESKLPHLKLVIECVPPFDASQVELSELLKKQFTNERSLEALFGMGMVVKQTDTIMAAKFLPESCIKLFRLLLSKCNQSVDLNPAYREAIRVKKIRFAICFIQSGAVSDDMIIQILSKAIKFKLDMDWIPELCKSDKIDFDALIINKLVQHPNGRKLIELLLDAGVNPNGSSEKNPLATIGTRQDITPQRKIDLICLFLEKGADCNPLGCASPLTTPLHVATKLAVETGDFLLNI